MSKQPNPLKIAARPIRFGLVLAMVLLVAMPLLAQESTRAPLYKVGNPASVAATADASSTDSKVTGEVESLKSYEGDVVFALVGWPVVIRITDDTVFVSESLAVSKLSAADVLKNRAVTVVLRMDPERGYLADSITIHDYAKLQQVRREREDDDIRYILRHKDLGGLEVEKRN